MVGKVAAGGNNDGLPSEAANLAGFPMLGLVHDTVGAFAQLFQLDVIILGGVGGGRHNFFPPLGMFADDLIIAS